MKKIRKHSMAEHFGFHRPPPMGSMRIGDAIADLRLHVVKVRRDLDVALEALESVGLVACLDRTALRDSEELDD